MTPRQVLLAKATEYQDRHERPRVAWDCMAAQSWAQACRKFARQVARKTKPEAVKELRMIQRRCARARGGDSLPSWYLQTDFTSEMDEIIEAVKAAE